MILSCSRESKYEIKGSKSRSIHEKNVIYRNFKNAILKGISWKNDKKKAQKKTRTDRQKANGRTAKRPNGLRLKKIVKNRRF